MAVPVVGGVYTTRGIASVAVNISDVPTGGWMLVSVMTTGATMVVTPPEGWTTLQNQVGSGSRGNYIFGKIKTSGDSSAATFVHDSATLLAAYGLIWGTGAAPVNQWIPGVGRLRSQSGEPLGARYTNTALGVTTTTSENLVLAISHEATNAMVTADEISSVVDDGGWNEHMRLQQVAVNDRIETIWMASKGMPSPGATGDVTLTYLSPHDLNGWAIQMVIPSASTETVEKPTIIGEPTSFIGSHNTTFTINRPADIEDGDYVVVAIRGQSSTMTVDFSATGFSRLGPAPVFSNSGWRVLGFFGRPIYTAATEPTSYTFTFMSEGAANRLVATAFVVRGVHLTHPLAGFYDTYGGDPNGGGRQTPIYAVNSIPSLQLFIAGSEFGASNSHEPLTLPSEFSPVTEVVTTTNIASSRTYLWVGSRDLFSASASAAAITWSTVSGVSAQTIALRSVNAVVEDAGLTMLDGNGDPVSVYYTTADGVSTPSEIVPMYRGFSSITEMLATPGFTWAHRGGSASYPEMSLYAYTQSVARGYGVLEVSLARTSDGVWFGMHDQTSDRTSGGTYGNASAQTWAQIQAQQIVVGAKGAPQPYARWEDIVAAYGNTHLFVVDPKYALGSHRTEFLELMNTTVGPDRAIMKFSGVGSGAANFSTAARAMGYETWGYFYAGDASALQGGNGALQTWGPSWTLIGMDYGASQAIWDEALALGLPVIAHIAPNQAAYDTAIAKGASGVQVSGVAVVKPVSWWTQ